MARKKCTSIGGQAVIEGVMMRGTKSIATAVRDESGDIVIESNYIKPVKEKNFLFRTPFIRGFISFGSTLITGMGTLLRSGEVFTGEEEPSKFDNWLSKKTGISLYNIVMGFAVVFGIALSLLLFFFLPQLITSGIGKLIEKAGVDITTTGWGILLNLIEGLVRIIIFVVYIALTTLMPDVKRTYMYHGAEHKTISCYEQGLEMNVENARKMSTVHDRCGTTFMFIVMVVSVLVFSFTGWNGSNFLVRFLIRLALIPVVSGISYEILKFMAKYDNWFVRICKAPGLALQKLTTKQPTDDMLEVAIAAFLTVLKMDEDNTIPVQKFDTKKLYKKAREEVDEILKAADVDLSDGDWIVCSVCGCKRSELATMTYIKESEKTKIIELAKLRATKKPLWRILGNVNFYGYELDINDNVLCPRPETEELVENAIKVINEDSKVLDLCTGSGCIAIAIQDKTKATVYASDVSKEALEVAKNNIDKIFNIEGLKKPILIESNMFENISEKVDVIVSNPPYIKTAEIDELDEEVKNYDPKLALDGGNDGYDFYRIIADNAKNILNDNGYIFLECGENQAETIGKLLEKDYNIEIKKDLYNVERFVIAKLK